jgi:hypothetical protein
MYEDHMFERLKGNTIEELLNHAEACRKIPEGKYGMMCPVKIIYSDRSERNVGEQVNVGNHWQDGIQAWKIVVESDMEIRDFMSKHFIIKLPVGTKFFVKKSFINEHACFKANLIESRYSISEIYLKNVNRDNIIVLDAPGKADLVFDFIYDEAERAAEFNDINSVTNLY